MDVPFHFSRAPSESKTDLVYGVCYAFHGGLLSLIREAGLMGGCSVPCVVGVSHACLSMCLLHAGIELLGYLSP